MRSRDASLSTTAGTGEAIISDAPRGEKLLETLHHPRFVAPSRNGTHHGVTPGTLRYLWEPGGDEHVLLEGCVPSCPADLEALGYDEGMVAMCLGLVHRIALQNGDYPESLLTRV